jgi:hypothetical protein
MKHLTAEYELPEISLCSTLVEAETKTSRAGNRRFWCLSALRAHTKWIFIGKH